jgi:Flp pilus assembly protein TadG
MRDRTPQFPGFARSEGRLAVPRPDPRQSLTRTWRATTAVEFAVCALGMVLIVVGFAEFGRLIWTSEVLQEAASQGARCMGLRAASCASAGTYNSANTTAYVVSQATAGGVVINGATVTLSNTASCGGAGGFSQVSINYNFTTVAPGLIAVLAHGFTLSVSACFPNNS